TKGIGWSDDERKADFLCSFFAFEEGVCDKTRRDTHPDLDHELAERLTVFGQFNGIEVYTDHLYLILIPDPLFACFDGEIQGRLATHCRQDRVDLLFFK